MKMVKTIYWISTSLIAALMVFSGISSLNNPEMVAGFQHLGFPSYFRVELGIAKLIGAVVLITPKIPDRLKEWAYVGFGITFLSAAFSHSQVGDPMDKIIAPIFIFVILVSSYITYHKTKV